MKGLLKAYQSEIKIALPAILTAIVVLVFFENMNNFQKIIVAVVAYILHGKIALMILPPVEKKNKKVLLILVFILLPFLVADTLVKNGAFLKVFVMLPYAPFIILAVMAIMIGASELIRKK